MPIGKDQQRLAKSMRAYTGQESSLLNLHCSKYFHSSKIIHDKEAQTNIYVMALLKQNS